MLHVAIVQCMMQSLLYMVIFLNAGVIANIAGDSDSEVDLLRTFCMKNHQPLTTNTYATLLLDSAKCFNLQEDLSDQSISRWLSMSTVKTQTSSTAIKCLHL